jgi:GT2 family glycosyltransferase
MRFGKVANLLRKRTGPATSPIRERILRWRKQRDCRKIDALLARAGSPDYQRECRRDYTELTARPRLSIVLPAYETPAVLLAACLRSISDQIYAEWELVIVDDGSRSAVVRDLAADAARSDSRIRLIVRETNGNIARASNDGLDRATGEFVLLVDHDDELTPDALLRVAQSVVRQPHVDVWYSDQVTCDEQGRVLHHFLKPDWSPTYFLGVMYVGHLLAVRRSLATAIGGFDARFDGVQDYEFMLRLAERTSRIGHIPRILYKWRMTEEIAGRRNAARAHVERDQRRAVAEHLDRLGRSWAVESRPDHAHRLLLKRGPRSRLPPVSIVVAADDLGRGLARCASSLRHATDYPQMEFVVVDNGTMAPGSLAPFAGLPIRTVPLEGPFTGSRAGNLGAGLAQHELLLFLSADAEAVHSDWLENLAILFEDPEIAVAGPILVDDDDRVLHAGLAVGVRGDAGPILPGTPADDDGYNGSLACAREVSASSGACLLIRRSAFIRCVGFSEEFRVAYHDVDLCLRLRALGQRTVCAAGARVRLHRSPDPRRGRAPDRVLLSARQPEALAGFDPYYNRALNQRRLDYSLA